MIVDTIQIWKLLRDNYGLGFLKLIIQIKIQTRWINSLIETCSQFLNLIQFFLYNESFFSVGVIAKKFSSIVDMKEQWYGTEYKLIKISEETLKVNNNLISS